VAEGLITPDQLRRIADEKEMEKAREALEKKRKAEDEQHHLHDAFMSQEIHPEVFERVSRVVKSAAERGEREAQLFRFPSAYCTDGGRATTTTRPTGLRRSPGSPSAPTSSGRRSSSRKATRCASRSWTSPAACRATSGSFSGGERRRLRGR
jgi:hypothetical protein